MKERSKKFTAFTLAEVLITLGIIGIVAAITIPTLMENNQKTQYSTQLKKAYTTFSQAVVQFTVDNGCAGDLECTGYFFTDPSNAQIQAFEDEFTKQFKVVKKCDVSVNGGCFSSSPKSGYESTSNWAINFNGMYAFVTADGASYLMSSPSCNVQGNLNLCGNFYVDVNGPLKNPNAIGRDIFAFMLVNGRDGIKGGAGIYPFGGNLDTVNGKWKDENTCTATDSNGCAARIIEEGWKMNY